MLQAETGRFTIGVFRDPAAADVGLSALRQQGFPPEALSLIAKEDRQASGLIEQAVGSPAPTLLLPGLGAVMAAGPLVDVLERSGGSLAQSGLAVALKRVGFQIHDGQIFERLVERGGILVAVRTESRAGDVLSTMHTCGGGNAAIGAWTGRLVL